VEMNLLYFGEFADPGEYSFVLSKENCLVFSGDASEYMN
jgi:hypothetical protein